MITLRPAQPGDGVFLMESTRALATVHDALDKFTATAADFETALFSPHPIIGALLAFHDGAFAGAAVWHRSFSTNRGREVMYLEDVSVLPLFQRKGVAKALFKAVARIAVEKGYKRIYWLVMDWNEGALKLYRGLGAKVDPQVQLCDLYGEALEALAK